MEVDRTGTELLLYESGEEIYFVRKQAAAEFGIPKSAWKMQTSTENVFDNGLQQQQKRYILSLGEKKNLNTYISVRLIGRC